MKKVIVSLNSYILTSFTVTNAIFPKTKLIKRETNVQTSYVSLISKNIKNVSYFLSCHVLLSI